VTLILTHAALTDIGRVRRENQDRWFADHRLGLYIVADGMGGGIAGGLAAQVVVDTLPGLVRQRLRGKTDVREVTSKNMLNQCLCDLSEHLRSESRDKPGLDGMGSTVVAVLVSDDQILIGHLGDSRAYLLRDGELTQLTTDHSIVQLLIHTGKITADEAPTHPARGQLSRFVGMEGEALPEVQHMTLHAGDRLLLCTDGLTGMLSDQQVTEIIASCNAPVSACRHLLEAANDLGGNDNITAVLIDANGKPVNDE
jgi:serine/threonine protein phosphatase PrpC